MTDLEKVLAFVDEDEGPELNISPAEPGGSSKHGVSMTVLREWRKKRGMSPPTMTDMSNVNSVLAAVIYSEVFAAPIRFNELHSGVNYRLLDISINLGLGGARVVLTEVLGRPVSSYSDDVIASLNALDPHDAILKLGAAWLHYKKVNGGWEKYGRGWSARAVRAEARALSMINTETTTMSWRLAGGITTLLAQVNEAFPHRRKDSDGGIGDARHQAERTSDHNPYIKVNGVGVVRAYDFTHAPETGFDAYAFAAMLLKNKDPRVRYVISNYKIASGKGGPSPWVWRPYNVPPNSNPHDHHTHVSLTELPAEFDSTKPWDLSSMAEAAVAHADAANNYVTPPPTLRVGSRGDLVKEMQRAIGLTGKNVDGFFGAGTKLALIAFQTKHGLKPIDGICGPGTWKVIRAK